MHPLIDVRSLAQQLNSEHLYIADCRHDLLDPEAGPLSYAAGHIAGAVHVHLDRHLSGPKSGKNGRHPLPDVEALQATLGALGIDNHSHVVAYDAAGGMYAARLWWLLRWLGHDKVQVLDGGWPAWLKQDGAVEAGSGSLVRPPVMFRASPRAGGTVDATELLAHLHDDRYLIVDARAPGRFAGLGETIDPVGGHIPGAVNRFFQENLDADGCFKAPEVLRQEWLTLLGDRSATATVQQCGSGVTACHNLLSLELAGLPGSRLYPGSWSEWCADPSRPVSRGEASL